MEESHVIGLMTREDCGNDILGYDDMSIIRFFMQVTAFQEGGCH